MKPNSHEILEIKRVAAMLAPAYKAIGWMWATSATTVPGFQDIERTIAELFGSLNEDGPEGRRISSGGITVVSTGGPRDTMAEDDDPDHHIRFRVYWEP